jgi:hypothetical protein
MEQTALFSNGPVAKSTMSHRVHLMSVEGSIVVILEGRPGQKGKDMGPIRPTRRTPWHRSRTILLLLVVVLLLAAGGGLLWRSAHSWSWYADGTGHFRIPVAPGWVASGFYNGPLQFSNCVYSVVVYPPGVTATLSKPDTEYDPRLLLINVVFPCNYGQQLSPHLFTNPLPTPVTINGKRTTLYDNSVPDTIGRLAIATFGGNQYQFVLDSGPTSVAKGDLTVFMRILAGFHYTGNG